MTRHQTVLFFFLFLPQRGRESDMHWCVCVCMWERVIRGWLDIHVALIIVPLLPGSRSGIGQALMWVWSHVTLGCWAEVAYWCSHHIVTPQHFLSGKAVWNESCHVCMRVLVPQCCHLNGNRVVAVRDDTRLVSGKFRGNEHDAFKYNIHVRAVRSLKRWHEKRGAEKTDGSFT